MEQHEPPTKACSHCARTHKKCDKKYPRCSLCTKKNRECVYEKSKRYINHPYTEKAIQPKYIPTLDEVVTFRITIDMPILTREKFNQVFNYICAEYKGETCTEAVPQAEELALVYAIQGGLNACYGHPEVAEYMYEKSRKILVEQFEQVSTVAVATSYTFLALYCGMNGDAKRAMFYLTTVKQYLDTVDCYSTLHVLFTQHMFQHVKNILSGESDVEHLVKGIISHHELIKDFRVQKSDAISAVIIDTKVETVDKIVTMRHDILERTNNYQIEETKWSMFSERFQSMYDQLKRVGISDKFVTMKKVMLQIYWHGLQLQRSQKAGNLEMAKESADAIARLINAPGYNESIAIVAPIICSAAKLHVLVIQSEVDFMERLRIAECMRLELLSLYTIIDRNKLLKDRCEELMLQLLEALRRVDEEVVLSQINTVLFEPPTPITIDFEQSSSGSELALPFDENQEVEFFDAVDLFFADFA